ncbi:MAG: penicillin-binding protein 1A [Gammaproteobacteria bacterium]
MQSTSKILKIGLLTAGFLTSLGLVVTVIGLLYLVPQLPSIEVLKDVKLQVPLRVYTSDEKLIAEFGEMKRTPLRYQEIPDLMVKAVLSAEDNRFFQHPGVDYQGLVRAAVNLIKTGEKSQGGSTITMQVARNFFLTARKTYLRKINEILLALKIERELSKEGILELYLNKIYLGNRAYGIAAAAQIYYGVEVNNLTLAQMAMISGLPKAPSRYNPIAGPERALVRRNYILKRMFELGYIDALQLQQATREPDNAETHSLSIETEAPYVAEMVRSAMLEQFGEDAYTSGFKVYTTLQGSKQDAANRALRKALIDYDTRHGYRGVEQHVDLTTMTTTTELLDVLSGLTTIGSTIPALVLGLEDQAAIVLTREDETVRIPWQGLSWANRYINVNRVGAKPKLAADILSAGDVIRIMKEQNGSWRLTQRPELEGAIISLLPTNGSITALSGGFDFNQSKFNRVIQARRQPGSVFKPFIYSAALEKGFSAASLINDAPVVFEDPGLESAWRPENYSGKFFGPTRLRQALIKSRNLVSIRILRAIGIKDTLDYVSRFGFDQKELPRNLSLSLGSGAITPLELATGYAVFANGGYKITPFFIDRIVGPDGEVLMQTEPETVCDETCLADRQQHAETNALAQSETETDLAGDIKTPPAAKRVIPAENAYIMTTILRDVIRRGTGRKARKLGRHDLSGKTGTTNDQKDAWFAGFNANLVTVSWVGFDAIKTLGNRETGARAALPMWVSYMGEALKNVPETPLKRPEGLITVRIDPKTGLLADSSQSNAIFETFRINNVPKRHAETERASSSSTTEGQNTILEQLF